MKRNSSEEVRDLRARKHTGEKKLSPHESKGLAKFKHVIAWIIVIAFIGTSGIMMLGLGAGAGKTPPARKKAGNPLEQAKKKNEADIKFWQDKIKADPGNSQNYFNLGSIYIDMGKEDEAVANFKKAIETDPKNSLALKYLAKIYVTQKNFKEAEKLLNQAAKANERDPEIYTLLAMSAQQQKNTGKAIEYLQKGLKADPGNVKLYMRLADLHHKNKDDKSAKMVIDEAFEIAKARHDKKGEIDLYVRLAMYAQDNKKTEKAVGHIRDALKVAPGAPILYIYIAEIYKKANDKVNARKALDEGIKLAKDSKNNRAVQILESYKKALDQPIKPPTIKVTPKPGDKKTGDKKPAGDKTGDAKPGDKKPAGDKTGNAKPADTKPAGDKTGDAKPEDTPAMATPGGEKAVPAPGDAAPATP